MCEPATLATIALATAGTSAAASAYGTHQQSKANKAMANYNAEVAEMEAQDARRQGDEEAARVRRANQQLAGAQRAAMAARGLDFSEGSAAEVLDQTDFFSQVDQQTARQNAARAAWNARARKQGYQFEAASEHTGTKTAISLLGGASQVASAWSGYKKPSGRVG